MIFKVLLLAGIYSSLSSLQLLAAARGVLSPIRIEASSPAGASSPFPMLVETPSPLVVKTNLLEEAAKAEDEHASVYAAEMKEITARIERLTAAIAEYQHQLDKIRAEIHTVQSQLNVAPSSQLTRRGTKLKQTLHTHCEQKASLEENICQLQKNRNFYLNRQKERAAKASLASAEAKRLKSIKEWLEFTHAVLPADYLTTTQRFSFATTLRQLQQEQRALMAHLRTKASEVDAASPLYRPLLITLTASLLTKSLPAFSASFAVCPLEESMICYNMIVETHDLLKVIKPTKNLTEAHQHAWLWGIKVLHLFAERATCLSVEEEFPTI